MGMKPRVLFVSTNVGAGHRQAAKALLAGLNQADPSIDAQWVDTLDYTSRAFRMYYASGYAVMVSHLPRLYGFGYRLTDSPHGPRRALSERKRLWTERLATRRFHRWLLTQRPVLVVNTHFLAPTGIGRMIAQGVEGVRQMTVVTDNELHRWWCSENVEQYFVSAEPCRQRLLDFGVPPERIELTGIPVHPKWTAPVDAGKVYADWNLPSDRPIVLVSGGVDFTIGRIDKIAAEICTRLPKVFVLVLAGGNKKLMARVACQPTAQGDQPCLRAVGFTDRIQELAHVASLIVTKPGGMITTECLTKGVGMVLLRPVPGQETANAELLCHEGAAVMALSAGEVVSQVARLLENPARLESLRANARRLAKPATEMIVDRIVQAVNDWK